MLLKGVPDGSTTPTTPVGLRTRRRGGDRGVRPLHRSAAAHRSESAGAMAGRRPDRRRLPRLPAVGAGRDAQVLTSWPAGRGRPAAENGQRRRLSTASSQPRPGGAPYRVGAETSLSGDPGRVSQIGQGHFSGIRLNRPPTAVQPRGQLVSRGAGQGEGQWRPRRDGAR